MSRLGAEGSRRGLPALRPRRVARHRHPARRLRGRGGRPPPHRPLRRRRLALWRIRRALHRRRGQRRPCPRERRRGKPRRDRRRELRRRVLDALLRGHRGADDPRHAPRARRVPRARRRAPRRQARQLSLHARRRRSESAQALRLWLGREDPGDRRDADEQCGTYAYLSPEMARRRPYDFKVDAWAAGVVAYMLLAGEPPFADWDAMREGRSPPRTACSETSAAASLTRPSRTCPSPPAPVAAPRFAPVGPDKRMSCKEAAEHYWVREKGAASHADALASTVERLQAYGTLGAVRRASIRRRVPDGELGIFDGRRRGSSRRWTRRRGGVRGARGRVRAGRGSKVGRRLLGHALMLALRDHGAELNPEEWLSLIRPVTGRRGGAGGTVFVDNAALAAMLATPAGGSFGEYSGSFPPIPTTRPYGTQGIRRRDGSRGGARRRATASTGTPSRRRRSVAYWKSPRAAPKPSTPSSSWTKR